MKYLSLPFVLLFACSNSNNDLLIDRDMALATDVTITHISLYQGPGAVLAQDGLAAAPDLPLIAGRDAMVRVFYTTEGRAGTDVTAILELADGESFEVSGTLGEGSTEESIESTFNFAVPGDLLSGSFNYRVYIAEEGKGGGDDLGALHPDEGFETHALELEHVLRVTLVPYEYNADGSGRLPDTSPEALAAIEDRFRQLYPISDVELTLHDPVRWSSAIEPNGAGWQEVILSVYGLRDREGASDDEYYYAMFNPRRSLGEFCSRGCLLGVTLLNADPETTGDPSLNMAIGVGYTDGAADTMLHELGHAHGRSHAPCGQGLDPGSIDRSYPSNDGLIGAPSYDVVGGSFMPSSSADIMSYCYPQWISEYNYRALFSRADAIRSAGQVRSALADAAPGVLVLVDGDGGATWAASDMALPQRAGSPMTVLAGFAEQVEGRFYRYDHLPGGWLVLPELQDVDTVSFELDGELYTVER